jgi:uncharacterized protein (DUF342 family)
LPASKALEIEMADTETENQAHGLMFRMSDDGKTLQAVFTPGNGEVVPDIERIHATLEEQGLSELYLLEDALKELNSKLQTSTEPFSLTIGERRDGTVSVMVSADSMSAFATVTPARGGTPIRRHEILAALADRGVVSGLVQDEVDFAAETQSGAPLPVAHGRAPEHGKDTQFEKLVTEMKDRHPHVDENGIADYRDLGLFVTVSPGQPLIRRIPPTQGTPGENVLGQALAPRPGKSIPFASGLKGTRPAPNDGDLLVAEIAGRPTLVPRGATVEPTLSVKRVDLSTGHLNFEGSVQIIGDVTTGMKVEATGDIHIGGTMEGARIDAGGDVVIKGGIVGTGELRDHAGNLLASAAQVYCGGSVAVRFVESGFVEAANSIIVDEFALQSELTAVNQVIVGKEGGQKGHVIGGVIRATLLAKMVVAGSRAGVLTTFEVGINPIIKRKLEAVVARIEALEKEKEELKRVLTFGTRNKGKISLEVLDKAVRTYDRCLQEVADLTEELTVLETEISLADQAKVVIGQHAFGGVHVKIGNRARHITDERGGGTFHLTEGEIDYLWASKR